MSNYKIVFLGFVVCIFILGLGCQPEETAKENSSQPVAPVKTASKVAEPVKADNGGIAVTVNGVDITEEQVEEKMRPQLEQVTAKIGNANIDNYKQKLREKVVESMIIEFLLEAEAEKQGITVSQEEVQQQLDKMAAMQDPPLSMDELKAYIEKMGRDFENMKQNLAKGLKYQKLMEAKFGQATSVSDEEVETFYSENKEKFNVPEQVRMSHILIKVDTSDPNSEPNEVKAVAKAKAEDLLKQIKAGGDFELLAKENSDCPSGQRGGDLGFSQKGRMVPKFEEAAFSMDIGQISDIVETRFGYHIIKVTGREDAKEISLEEAKEKIVMSLKAEKQNNLTGEYITSLKDSATIVYPAGKEPEIKPSSSFDATRPAKQP